MRKVFLLILAIGTAMAACADQPVRRAKTVQKAPDERAVQVWIQRAFQKQGFDSEFNRAISLSGGAEVKAEVAAKNGKWAVVWLRGDEQDEAKGKLPKAPEGIQSGKLWVHPGQGNDKDFRVLILLEQHYMYNPDPGESQDEYSFEAVEARTIRDVNDFLVRAKAGQIP